MKIPTGSKKIDAILDGGISAGDVLLVYGDPEAGKTTLAIQCAVNCAERGSKVLFVDCDNTFSSRRLLQIVNERVDEVVAQIILMRPNDFEEQTRAIDHLEDYLTANFGLLVVDTISTLYRLRVAETPKKTFELNRELNRQVALVAQVAKTRKVAVLMTSQVRSAFNEGYVIEPVATRVLKFWADAIIAMHPAMDGSGLVNVVLEKIPQNERTFHSLNFSLKIEKSGLLDYSPR
jgi:RecA/RadA recombinase